MTQDFLISRPRRMLLKGAAAAASAIAWPVLLSACGGGTDSSLPAVSREFVLAWGEFGELKKGWGASNTLSLVRPDGTSVIYGTTRSELNGLSSAAVAPDGTFWIADSDKRRVVHLDSALRYLGAVGSVSGQRFSRPTGVALMPDGRLVVSDALRGQVAIVDTASGVGIWGGIDADQHIGTGWRPHWESETDHRILDWPKFVHVTPKNTVVVLDTAAARLVLFSASGVAMDSLRVGGHPSGFAMAPDGTCYVCDLLDRTVRHVNLETRVIDTILTAQQANEQRGLPEDAVWRTASGPDLSNLMLSVR